MNMVAERKVREADQPARKNRARGLYHKEPDGIPVTRLTRAEGLKVLRLATLAMEENDRRTWDRLCSHPQDRRCYMLDPMKGERRQMCRCCGRAL